jgi:ElaB/YqjD/DUF883 family membrane-anchored ribosome-binding protein
MSTPERETKNPADPTTRVDQQRVSSPHDDQGKLKSDFADEARTQQERAADAVSSAAVQVDRQREQVASGAMKAADQLREHAADLPGGDKSTELAQGAAVQIERAAGYLQDHDMSNIGDDIVELVRAHPKESIIVALAAGLLLGRALRS